jgi:hypothetical protein
MNHRSLATCIAAGWLLPFFIPLAQAAPPLRTVPLASLSSALSPDAHPRLADNWVNRGFDGRIVWVDDAELGDAEGRQRMMSALDAGLAVLVTRRESTSENTMSLLGFQADARRAIYVRSATDTLKVAYVADEIGPTQAAGVFSRWVEAYAPPPKQFKLFASLVSLQPAESTGYVPRLYLESQTNLEGDRQISHKITIRRDIRPGMDENVLSVETDVRQRPEHYGPFWNGHFNAEKGYHLFIPLRYDIVTSIAAVGSDVPIRLDGMQPTSGKPSTEVKTARLSTESGGGSSVPANIMDFLTTLPSGAAGALGKLPTLFPGTDRVVETHEITVPTADYEVQARLYGGKSGMRHVTWSFELSSDIAHDHKRFQDGYSKLGYPYYSLKKVTNMMKSAHLQTASSWRLPGEWRGKIDVTTRATVVNRVFFDESLPGGQFETTEPDHPASDTHFTMRVDLDSPLLTHQPTVRLQSLEGEGKCLAQPNPAAPEIAMQTCDAGLAGREQQWFLDIDSTYRNRASGDCLTTDLTDGAIRAETCYGAALNQQWMWSADRLHSKANGGDRWRLHLRKGVPNAKFDPTLHDAIRPNRHHALLPPWWSYPAKPSPGDTAPNPNGISHVIYDEISHYRRVSDDQRWQIHIVTDKR